MVTRGWGAPGSWGREWLACLNGPVGWQEANHCPGMAGAAPGPCGDRWPGSGSSSTGQRARSIPWFHQGSRKHLILSLNFKLYAPICEPDSVLLME